MDKIRSDGRKVEFVRVVCHTSGIWPNGMMSDNHWSIYLVFGNNSSVRMNMRGDLDNQKGTLEWSTLDYDVTTSAIQYWDYKIGPGVTVAHIHGLVMGNGRDQYNVSGGGSGCRYWMYM